MPFSWVSGSMCYMSGSIQMDSVFVPENEAGMWQWLFGKSLSSVVLLNSGTSDGFVGIAAPSLAKILPVGITPTFYACNFIKFVILVVEQDPYISRETVNKFLFILILQIDLALFGGELLCQVLTYFTLILFSVEM